MFEPHSKLDLAEGWVSAQDVLGYTLLNPNPNLPLSLLILCFKLSPTDLFQLIFYLLSLWLHGPFSSAKHGIARQTLKTRAGQNCGILKHCSGCFGTCIDVTVSGWCQVLALGERDPTPAICYLLWRNYPLVWRDCFTDTLCCYGWRVLGLRGFQMSSSSMSEKGNGRLD